jgi:hypothetical protein
MLYGSPSVGVMCFTYSDPTRDCPMWDSYMGVGMGHKGGMGYICIGCATDHGFCLSLLHRKVFTFNIMRVKERKNNFCSPILYLNYIASNILDCLSVPSSLALETSP